jgi:mannose-6-phosphate isomerase-like protein (cupin superfamily)
MPPVPVSRADAEHYTWGDACDAWHLVKHEKLSVIEERMPPGAAEVRHFHQDSQQFFYVLAGEAVMEVQGQAIVLARGQGLHIPPGTPHQIRNSSNRPVDFLVISQPQSRGDRVDS